MEDNELYGVVIMFCAGGGGLVGTSAGIYTGYISNRHKSYHDCATQTVSSALFCGAGGVLAGFWLGLISPIVIPVACIIIPIASGTVIVKYIEENVNTHKAN